jgi:hypothetical protein
MNSYIFQQHSGILREFYRTNKYNIVNSKYYNHNKMQTILKKIKDYDTILHIHAVFTRI